MKVFFNRYPRYTAYGGGNQFLQKMTSLFTEKGHEVVYHLQEGIDLIFMMDPRPGDHGYSIQHIWSYKQNYPNVKIIHRINECDKRKSTHGLDEILIQSANISDKVVFISEWLQEYFEKSGYQKDSKVIYNGCDTNHFYPDQNTKINEKIRLVTHHWSDNWLKGFDIYTEIDKYLSDNSNAPFEFTYVGRYCKEYNPEKTILVPPLHGKELGDELRRHDIYVTASRWEPCGMHHIEGAASGMPVLYHEDSGGIVELCQNHGKSFNSFESFLEAFDEVSKNYNDYAKKINYENLKIEKCAVEFYNTSMEMFS
jgi:glycosyltransferase involved in cell wall biosynthesis